MLVVWGWRVRKNSENEEKREKNYMIRVSRWLQGDYYVSLLGILWQRRGNNALLHFMVKWTKRRLKHTIVKEKKKSQKKSKNSFQVFECERLAFRFVYNAI